MTPALEMAVYLHNMACDNLLILLCLLIKYYFLFGCVRSFCLYSRTQLCDRTAFLGVSSSIIRLCPVLILGTILCLFSENFLSSFQNADDLLRSTALDLPFLCLSNSSALCTLPFTVLGISETNSTPPRNFL